MLTQTTSQIVANYSVSYGRNIASLCAGVNDLRTAGRTPQQVHYDLATWISGHKAIGFTTVLQTITPSTYSGAPADIYDQINATNALIRADKCGADYLVDVAADPRLDDSTDATYYSDGLHRTIAGYDAVAELVSACGAF